MLSCGLVVAVQLCAHGSTEHALFQQQPAVRLCLGREVGSECKTVGAAVTHS